MNKQNLPTRKQVAQLLKDAGVNADTFKYGKDGSVEFWDYGSTVEDRGYAKRQIRNLAARMGYTATFHRWKNVFYLSELPAMPGLEEMLVAVNCIAVFAEEIGGEIDIIQRRAIPTNGRKVDLDGIQMWGYFLPIDPNVGYLEPIGPDPNPTITIEDAVWMSRNNRYGIYWGANRVLAVYDHRDETFTALLYCELRLKEYWFNTFEVGQRFTIMQVEQPTGESYELRRGWSIRNDVWEVDYEIHPITERHSNIRVDFDQKRGATVGWYSTIAKMDEATRFHAAYGRAIEVANQLQRDLGLESDGEQE